MKIKTAQSLTNCDTVESLNRYVSVTANSIIDVVNGNLSTENIVKTVASVEFTATNTDTVVKHGLNNVPTGYIVIGSTVAMTVYNGTKDFTDDSITIKSTATGTATILIFL